VRYRIAIQYGPRALQAQVAVVQGNVDQAVKWSPAFKTATIDTYLRLSREAIANTDVELVVWPETALPFYPQRDQLTGRLAAFTGAANTWLLTGAPLFTLTPQADGGELVRHFNGAILLAPDGRLAASHAKQHLVPFGEYVPLRPYLPFLEPLVVSVGDFTAGTSDEPLALGPMRLGLLICYESIFPDIARRSVSREANLLVNLTNDAWYGRSSAPHQSMAMAVFRAVENKRALVRAANTGISGFVDPVGNIVERTGLFVETALVQRVPLLDGQTVFNRQGHLFGPACAVVIPLCLLLGGRRR
jgi:apolipoprotein N-acyltransferase